MNKEERIEILKKILKIESINDREEEVAKVLEEFFNRSKIETKLQKVSEGRSNLIADYKNGEKILGLSGHMDVVSIGDESKWKHQAFGAEIEDGKIYARGSSDMKAGLAALAVAMKELDQENFEGSIRLLATVGEEVGQAGSKKLAEEGYVDDLCGLLIGEPSFTENYSEIAYAHMGSFNYKITAHGKSAHSSMPELGISAIDHIIEFANILKRKMQEVSEKYENEVLGRTIFNMTLISGGEQINSVAEKAVLEGNIRTIAEFNNDKIEDLIKELIEDFNKDGHNLELEVTQSSYAVESSKDNKLARIISEKAPKIKASDIDTLENLSKDLKDKIKKDGEIKVPLAGLRPVTDSANFYRRNSEMDLAIYGPGQVDLAHQVDEYCYVDRYLYFCDLYKEVIREYFKD